MVAKDIRKSPIFKAMLTGDDLNMEDLQKFEVDEKNIIYLLVSVDIIAVLFVYAQIEIYQLTNNSDAYTFGTLRKVVCVIFFFGLMIFSRLFSSFNNQIDRLIQYIIIQFFFIVGIPLLMIVKNDKILHSLREKFPCYNENIHSLAAV